jgi:hypothetical protein
MVAQSDWLPMMMATGGLLLGTCFGLGPKEGEVSKAKRPKGKGGFWPKAPFQPKIPGKA